MKKFNGGAGFRVTLSSSSIYKYLAIYSITYPCVLALFSGRLSPYDWRWLPEVSNVTYSHLKSNGKEHFRTVPEKVWLVSDPWNKHCGLDKTMLWLPRPEPRAPQHGGSTQRTWIEDGEEGSPPDLNWVTISRRWTNGSKEVKMMVVYYSLLLS